MKSETNVGVCILVLAYCMMHLVYGGVCGVLKVAESSTRAQIADQQRQQHAENQQHANPPDHCP
jgi:hypothetical protein